MPRGYLALVLHAHLPFVRHPEHERSLEERWFFEALAECYLPLLAMFARLDADEVPFALSMSLTAPLASMLKDELLCRRFEDHLARMEKLADFEIARLESDPYFGPVAHFYQGRFAEVRATWERISGDVVGALVALADRGDLDLLACSATHAYLPGLVTHPKALRGQLTLGVAAHRQLIGREPLGMWLPECAYDPSFEHELASTGIRYTLLDAHGITRATPRPPFGVFHPIVSPAGVAFFARDADSARQVWSRESGFPGNPFYRDFYRDIGFDLPEELLHGEVGPYGARVMTGLKYHRITGRGDQKLPYQPGIAEERARIDAATFVHTREEHVRQLAVDMPVAPIVVAPYDAELFGHWWFEGPLFLEHVFRELHAAKEREVLVPITLRAYLERHPTALLAEPASSSWGAGGFGEVWVGPAAARYWRHVHHASRYVEHLVSTHRWETGLRGEALDLAIRELLLLQTSDWPFIVRTGSTVEYAESRIRAHAYRVHHLGEIIESDVCSPDDAAWVRDSSKRDNFLAELPSEVLRKALE